jgi:hypothetical protein
MHPVHDFLFIYYRFAPALLEQWHPGIDLHLETGDSGNAWSPKFYTQVNGCTFLEPAKIDSKIHKRLNWSLSIIKAALNRAPQFGCFGLHEWAMVYRGGPEGRLRHEGTLPLRLTQQETDQVVESQPICCSHFDAFRFFTESAQPLNLRQPTQAGRLENEQAGCLHTNMDLYKWTAKSMPWLSSDLLWETFLYAGSCREIDMRASPYDCRQLGYEPIRVETAEGRVEYEDAQRKLAEQARPIRLKLITELERILKAAPKINL